MTTRFTWQRLTFGLAFFYVPWLLIGIFFNQIAWFLFIATFILLLVQLYYQVRLSTWLWNDKKLSPPKGKLQWVSIFRGLEKAQRRHRKKQRELTQSIRLFRNGAESLPDAVLLFADGGDMIWCNRLAEQLLGFRWHEESNKKIFELIDAPELIFYLSQKDFSSPLELSPPYNSERIFELRIATYSEKEYLMLIRDITQLKLLEGMRRNFIANVSHELRTPLTVLQGYLEMTEDPNAVSPIWNKAHTVMTEQTNRMNNLVSQLLTLSKIEAAPHVSSSNEVDVPSILANVELEAIGLSGEKQHQFIFDVDKRLTVYGDEDQLRSAISNLVYNAVRYTPAGSKIKVVWKKNHKGVVFSVKDTGDGIEPQHLHRLTERFYRVDKARSRDTGGSGLGLAIVKHALTHHDSKLEIISQVGAGSEFFFMLPKNLMVPRTKLR